MDNFLTVPNNDCRTQDGTADLSDPNNTKDNTAAALLRSSKLLDAEECLLISFSKGNRQRVLRLLQQAGFDVGDVNVLAARLATDADKDQETNYVREFCDDILPRAQWDLPFRFLRDLYAGWVDIHHPGAEHLSTTKITRALKPLVGEYGWQFPPLNSQGKYSGILSANRMDKPEPMIVQFNRKDWMGPAGYLTLHRLKSHYTGLLRQ